MPLAAINDEMSVIARKALFLAIFFFFSGGWITALNPARPLAIWSYRVENPGRIFLRSGTRYYTNQRWIHLDRNRGRTFQI